MNLTSFSVMAQTVFPEMLLLKSKCLVEFDYEQSIDGSKSYPGQQLPSLHNVIWNSASATQFYLLFCSQYHPQCSVLQLQPWEPALSEAIFSSHCLLVSSRFFILSILLKLLFHLQPLTMMSRIENFIFYFDFGTVS